jgi:polar amino acid transport system substrate-binding protein
VKRRALLIVVLGGVIAASAGAAAPPTKTPGELTVALAMPSAGFQVGAVRGKDVVLAKGFEVELARDLARRLELRLVRFVNEPLHSTLVTPGAKPWDLAIAQITITAARAARVDFSSPYLKADQGVLVRRGLRSRPGSIAALRSLQLCAERATTGGRLVLDRIKPVRRPLLLDNPSRLSYELFTHRCDAIIFDAPALAVLQRQAPDRYGPLVGRIPTGEQYGIALEKGSALRSRVDAALAALGRDGRLARLRTRWLGVDTSVLPSLR